MFNSLTRTIALALFATAFALSPISAAPPPGRGGGGGGGGGEEETAPYSVTPLHITCCSGASADEISNPAGGVVYVAGRDGTNSSILWQVGTDGSILGSTAVPISVDGVTSDGLVVGGVDLGGIVGTAWKDGVTIDLPLVFGDENYARDVNDSWQIAGRERTIDPDTGDEMLTGAYWELDADGNVVSAIFVDMLPMAINEGGLMAGRLAGDPPVPAIAQVEADGSVTVTSLGLPPGADAGFAIDVNNFGEVAGHYWAGSENYGFRWSPDAGYEDIGTLHRKSNYSRGWGIDDLGVVVGQSSNSKGDVRAIIRDGAGMADLNDLIPSGSGVDVLTEGSKINFAGQILCTGWNGAAWQTYLLSPTP